MLEVLYNPGVLMVWAGCWMLCLFTGNKFLFEHLEGKGGNVLADLGVATLGLTVFQAFGESTFMGALKSNIIAVLALGFMFCCFPVLFPTALLLPWIVGFTSTFSGSFLIQAFIFLVAGGVFAFGHGVLWVWAASKCVGVHFLVGTFPVAFVMLIPGFLCFLSIVAL
jgi:hypothetical protein